MFEISWSELLIVAVVTLIFVGPKELPAFMRTIGKYAGVVKRHAMEFRSHFDAAMREAELDEMRREVEQMQASINAEVMRGRTALQPEARELISTPAHSEPQLEPDPAAAAEASTPPMPATPRQGAA
jgi:sec-independent protein translocase protein TatB